MANRIKGITVEIGGDTTGLDKALKSVNTSIRSTQSALKDVNRLLKLESHDPFLFFSLTFLYSYFYYTNICSPMQVFFTVKTEAIKN